MTFRPELRTLAFIMIGLAAIVGLTTRIVIANARGPRVQFAGIQNLGLRAGQSIGNATFDGVEENDVPGVRLRTRQCNEPIFAVPILLIAVAVPEVSDRAYGSIPGYGKKDVYSGQVHGELSRFSKLFKRSFLETYNVGASYFVRFYAPANCEIANETYVRWADAILTPGSRSAPAGETD